MNLTEFKEFVKEQEKTPLKFEEGTYEEAESSNYWSWGKWALFSLETFQKRS